MSMASNSNRLGRPRGIGFGILLFIVTFGFYGWYWAFKTQEETKEHTGQGLGGVLGLVVWILISAVSAFVVPPEVGKMYRQDCRAAAVTGWAGLWRFPGRSLVHPAAALAPTSRSSAAILTSRPARSGSRSSSSERTRPWSTGRRPESGLPRASMRDPSFEQLPEPRRSASRAARSVIRALPGFMSRTSPFASPASTPLPL